MTVLLLAGILKSIDVVPFLKSLMTWRLLPAHVLPVIAVVVPAMEIAVALGWFLSVHRKAMSLVAILMLIGFSAVYISHVLSVGVPDCACVGIRSYLESQVLEVMANVCRNLILISALLFGYFGYRPAGESHERVSDRFGDLGNV